MLVGEVEVGDDRVGQLVLIIGLLPLATFGSARTLDSATLGGLGGHLMGTVDVVGRRPHADGPPMPAFS